MFLVLSGDQFIILDFLKYIVWTNTKLVIMFSLAPLFLLGNSKALAIKCKNFNLDESGM